MSLKTFLIPLLLLTTAVQTGVSFNVGYVTMPLFEMFVKNLPQNPDDTADDFTSDDNQQALNEFFNKVRVIDAWKATTLDLDLYLRDKVTTIITDARVQFDRKTIVAANLVGYNCTRYCYNVSVPLILNVTGWTEDRLNGKVPPTVRMADIHEAVVKAIEERFCCNMTQIAIDLGLDPILGVKKTSAYIDVWERFVPHVTEKTIQCKADALQVTSSELAELLRTDLATLRSYDLNQMDLNFFPAYEDLLRRKNLFETQSIVTGGLFNNWESSTMAQFADRVSSFSLRDLEILYRWEAPQLFAIENIPMSIFQSGCTTVPLVEPLFAVSQTLFGHSTNLPICNVAFLLSRSFDEVNTKFTISSLSDQNVLEIFRTSSGNLRWFDIYQLLQLNIDEGIWVETPTLTQIALFRGIALNSLTAQNSIPMAISNIKTFNTTSTLNTIMRTNYNSFLTRLLNTYGYSSSGLALSAGITEAQLNSLTIQEAHNLIINSIEARYRINDVAALLGIAQVDTHVLINLPSFEWEKVVAVAIQNAFAQSADAFSVMLSAGGVQISTIEGTFPAIQVTDAVTYHTNRTTPTELASCLNKQLSDIYNMSFAEYHQLHINNIVPLLRIKLLFEVQSMETLLNSGALDFDDVKYKNVTEVITQLTGMTIANLQCLYGWSNDFINTDLAITFQEANETRLCNDFLGRTMFNIVAIISQTPSKVCFLCTIGPCGQNTMCRDVPDSYVCTCLSGYIGNPSGGGNCIDNPECLFETDDCHDNATCRDVPGSFECTCKTGFVGDGRNCTDINECNADPGRCGPNGICRNTIGSFFCDCQAGYRWNGSTCVDVNECTENSDDCHFAAICTNNIGSFTCRCPNGLSGDGRNCVDILECSFAPQSFPCHVNADCTETFGSFVCRCKDGYTGDGQICTDINECEIKTDDCHVNATCFNTDPAFFCRCHSGFTGNGKQCADINECDQNLDNCHDNASCINTIGSFYCDCKDGFNGNGTYCYVAEVSFTKASHVVNEGGDVAISFLLNGEIDENAVVTIQVGGSATENEDYSPLTKVFLYTPGGSRTKTFTITTTDDQRLEGLETIVLTLSSVNSHVTPGNIPSTTITIIDNDAIAVAFSSQTYTVNEDDDFANITVQINSGIVERNFVVSLSTSSGTALAGADFTTHSQQLTFSPGNAGSQLVRIPLVDNLRVEGDEQFFVSLSTTDPDVNIVNSPATVTIVDDDVATVKFQSSTYEVSEGGNEITVKLDITGVRDVNLTARLNTGNAGATAGADYTSITNRDVNIPTYANVISLTIPIREDGILENNEIFTVTVTSQSLPRLITANPAITIVTIMDNDVVSVAFSQSPYFTEEENKNVSVRVVVTGTLERNIELSLSTRDGDAIEPDDYQQNTRALTFIPGGPKEIDVPIQIFEDVLIENTETLTVELTTTDPDIVFPNGKTATITINDDDTANVFIRNDQYVFLENAVTTNIPVELQGSLAITVSVRLSTVHDTATWPSDFAAISNQIIEFKPGESLIKQVPVNIADDEVVESTETFSVTLSTQNAKVAIGTYGTATVSIIDNDQLRVNFSSKHYEADEDSGFALIGLMLHDVLETMLKVRLTPSNGTATEPQDFPLINYDVTLEPGQPRIVYHKINITNDMLEEYDEHFILTLTRIDVNVQIIEARIANITIGESDDIFFCDPNAKSYPCHIKADCVDVPSSFECTCVSGYEGDGKFCTNKNECLTIQCPFNATCKDTIGSYTCICRDGFRGDGVTCVDINECGENTHECHEQATCSNNLGSYTCLCNEGYHGNGRNCSDINECAQTNDCHVDANCINKIGSYDCKCKPGFRGDGKTCDDINECNEGKDDCHREATCHNGIGNYTCRCKPGWQGNGTFCMDINECLRPEDNDCDDVNGMCLNNDGSYTCKCNSGYSGDGESCVDIDECLEGTATCPDNADCKNTNGSYECICNHGFIHQGLICADKDECATGDHNCHGNANCLNIPGSFNCQCKDGFTGNGTFCSNVDECSMNPGPCDQNANCSDTDGSFECTCRQGFTGNGIDCEDIIDCILLPRQYPCDVRATCLDVPGSFTCTCPSGLTLNADQRNCDDIDECASNDTFTCHKDADCENTIGSYECRCRSGFVGDGKTVCIDTTCTSQNPCSADADCSVNVTSNSFTCVCHQGFTGDGRTCDDINECQIPGFCGANTSCVNQPRASYTCSCLDGYEGDPKVGCSDINECKNNPCHVNATCTNEAGTYRCDCNSGFSGNGTVCNDINECRIVGTCHTDAVCKNTIGSHYCTCNAGYSGNGKSCSDINECDDASNCPANADCHNFPGTFNCTCKLGFRRNGDACEDINECDGNPCIEDGAVCRNTIGSYTCTCPEEIYNNGNFCYVYCPFKLDLAFIVDTSNSINAQDFDLVKQFMTDSLSKMDISPDGNHIAGISFGNTANLFMRFNTITGSNLNRRNLINEFNNFPKNGGVTRIDLALLRAEIDVFTAANGMRTDTDIRKIAVVLTDGEQTMGPGVPLEPLSHIARRLQSKDITVIAVAIGQNVPRDQLLNITNFIEENILEVATFANLSSIIDQFVNTSCTDLDECKLHKNLCHANANCKDTLGAFSCLCKTGYSGDGFECKDVNECDGVNECHANSMCSNTDGSYECTCKPGYSGDGRQCSDINECDSDTDNCHDNADCINNIGSYTCQCSQGYSGDGKVSCRDIDECDEGTDNCDDSATCRNNNGSFTCSCNKGLTGSGVSCQDIDECKENTHDCHVNANCVNIFGSFNCTCLPGYEGDGKNSCNDQDECQLGEDSCLQEAQCNNTIGSYSCTCPGGYEGNGKTECKDVNECVGNKDDCHSNAECSNTIGSFVCTCQAGYSGDGKNCEVSGCTVACNVGATCQKVGSEFKCVCKQGYSGDGNVCSDIDECKQGGHNCHSNANCTNIEGSFMCKCKDGYSGDGKSCSDINECDEGVHDCDSNADCTNTEGSYMCSCKDGFTGDGKSCSATGCTVPCNAGGTCQKVGSEFKCVCNQGFTGNPCKDINECKQGGHDCHSNANCTNIEGGFMCKCKDGYSGDGKSCSDINECKQGGHDCHSNANCTDIEGGFTCKCKDGYSGDGKSCSDIDECKQGGHDCHSNANCTNIEGSFMCKCKDGYSGDGKSCSDIDECLGGHDCHSNADCKNNQGSFTCKCKDGYTGDGKSCSEIFECGKCNPGTSECVNNQCRCKSGYENINTEGTCDDIDECAQSSDNNCAENQACRNYAGTHECFCTSPGTFLIEGSCASVSAVTLTITILDQLFTAALADTSSADFYDFITRLEDRLNAYFKRMYESTYLDSSVLNLSNGSVVAKVLLLFEKDKAPQADSLNSIFMGNLNTTTDNNKMLNEFKISGSSGAVIDYDECDPTLNEHVKDCPQHSYCKNSYSSYSCECLKGYEKYIDDISRFCLTEDDDWWIVYAVVFGAIGVVVITVIILFCFLETRRNEELYTLHEVNRPHDKRIDEEVAPGFPGSVPRTDSNGSQLLLGTDKGGRAGSEKLAMYEVNPIYDTTNG
ncbi:uncharacterized protein LOC114518753 [Dendronephthya gigantea]|uniref:uncharacterized protein LOC114518753 n=1 Tax=Dendronephthya gigantea TaxID=151771 RepID=UPI00106D4AEE|nr:uncharacterized protein LOC114518753 [Dendronephthya gigantea]